MSTLLYLRADTGGSFARTNASANIATWTATTDETGPGALGLSPVSSTRAQLSIQSAANVTSGSNYCAGQFVSQLLDPGTVLAGSSTTVDVGFAIAGVTSAANAIQGRIAIYVISSTGSTQATILAATTVGSSKTPTNAAETTAWATGISLNATPYTVVSGDRLVVEIGAVNNGAVSQKLTAYYNGTTLISADNASTASAQSFINFSQTVGIIPSTTYYLDPGTTGPGTLPGAFVGTWSVSATAGSHNGSGAGYCATTSLASALTASAIVASTSTSQEVGLMQFISDPLAGQDISGNVTISMPIKKTTGGVNGFTGYAKIMLITSAGTLRSTLYDGVVGTTQTASSIVTSLHTISTALTSQTATEGDRFCIELGTQPAATANSTEMYSGGQWPAIPNGSSDVDNSLNSAAQIQFDHVIQTTLIAFWVDQIPTLLENSIYRM